MDNQIQPFIGVQAPRIPYIRFEQRPLERRTEDGGVYYEDVDFALITAQGSKDTTEKIWREWVPQIKRAAMDGQYPPGWIPRFEEMYKIWKETNQDPVIGTPVKNWPAVSAAECKMLLNAGARSIEELAEANEELVGRIGMGARRLKQLAIDWMAANTVQGPIVGQMDVLRTQVEDLTREVKELREANASLLREAQSVKQSSVGMQFPVEMPSPEERLSAVRGDSRGDEDAALDDVLRG
jgi:FtsZ-binding cell division protein ZapB